MTCLPGGPMSFRREWRRGPYAGGNKMLVVPRRRTVSVSDPYRSLRRLIIHADGSNGSTSVVDTSPSPASLTVNGSATISTSQSRHGGSSLSFLSATAGSVSFTGSSRLQFTGDFTIEAWVFLPSVPAAFAALFEARSASLAQPYVVGFRNVSGLIRPEFYTGAVQIQHGSLPINTWTHVAWVRSGTTLTTYINRTAVGSTTYAGSVTPAGSTVHIGRLPYDGINATFFADEIVVTAAALTPAEFAFDAPVPDS